MNAVIYAKVSSKNQFENSIKKQTKACKNYAKEKGYKIIKKYVDIGSRKKFQQMIKDSSKKKFELVIVYKFDKFAKNRYDSVIYKEILKQNDVKVVYAGEDASGILMESVLEGMAEYYLAELGQKVNKRRTEMKVV